MHELLVGETHGANETFSCEENLRNFTLLVCDWLHSVGQNHFYVMMHLNRDSAIQSSSRRFCTVYKSVKSNPLQLSGRRDILSGRSTVQASFVHVSILALLCVWTKSLMCK
jgi:hypothetical protein